MDLSATPFRDTDPVDTIGTSTAFGATNQRTTLWAVSFDSLLCDPSGLFAFKQFLEKEFSAENIHFWIACRRLRDMVDELKIRTEVRAIYDHYLSPAAEEPVNIDNLARSKAKIEAADADVNSFLDAEHQIYNLMKHDSYQRFLKSEIFAKFVKKEATGKELPQLDIKTGRIKKSSHTFFNWTHSSSFKGPNPISSNRHKRLSLAMRPRSLNLESGSSTAGSVPSVTSSKTTPASLSSSHRNLSQHSSSDHDGRRNTITGIGVRPLPSESPQLSRFTTSPNQSESTSLTSDSYQSSSLPPSETYPTPPPVTMVRRNLCSNPVSIGSTKYEFFGESRSKSNLDTKATSRSNLEKAEDDLLSSIISAAQHAPKVSNDAGLSDFDSPRDLYRFLSQPDLMSPAFMDTDEPMGAYLSPSLGDVPKECRKMKRGHRLLPPPIPVGKSRPLAPLPPYHGASSSTAGRTPLKRITTNNYDQYSSILV